MLLKRCISWNTALRDIRSDRTRTAPGIISARSLIQGLTRIRRTRLVTPAGAFVRATIMAAAVEAAKAHQLRTGAPWSVSMPVGLTAAWRAAKADWLSTMVREHAPAERIRKASRCVRPRLIRGEGEGSDASHSDTSPLAPLTRSPLGLLVRGLPNAAVG